MTRYFIAAFLIMTTAVSCNTANEKKNSAESSAAPDYTKLEQASWLLGNWENLSEDGTAMENWEKENDSTFKAESFIIAEEDTVFYEKVTLQLRKDTLDFVVSTRSQNEAPVSFRLVHSDENTLVFENPKHDFPTKITYNKISADSIYAEISGAVNGSERKEGFPFKKSAS
ncbi:MAG TPA: DUF6265 family protein [Niabella sp.]|nr:DUF6265 family protein [Niabella sp.]